MNDTVLVTCMYLVKYTEPLGGRGYPIMTYYPSLLNIFNIGLPLIIYTSEDAVEMIEEFCKSKNFFDYDIRVYDLAQYRHYDTILNLKEKYVNPQYRYFHRCEVLCHSKLHFFEQSFNNKWNAKKVVWIDAGITEASKVPIKYGGRELGENNIIQRYSFSLYPNNQLSLFTPKLGVALSKVVEDKKWFFVTLNAPFDGFTSPWLGIFTSLTNRNLTTAKWVVGTLWGGYKEEFDEMYKEYNKLVDATITPDSKLFPKTEEMYFSVVNHSFNKFTFKFDTWFIDVPGEIEYLPDFWRDEPNSKSFYKVFNDILEHKYN